MASERRSCPCWWHDPGVVTRVPEIESKYDVGARCQLPDLATLAGVASVDRPQKYTLEAVYLDSVDLRLLADGVTLRRRTGGADAGWHLKLPAADGARHELQLPLEDAAERLDRTEPDDGPAALGRRVPAQLLGLVRARLRGAEPVPVARLLTHRVVRQLRDVAGTVLAEVADDTVTAQVLGSSVTVLTWREWEVELGPGGDRRLLAEVGSRLITAGATTAGHGSKLARALADRVATQPSRPVHSSTPLHRRSRAGDVVVAYLAGQVQELRLRDPEVRQDRPDAVHKARVASRRLRSALRTYRPLLDREVTDPVGEELGWLAGVLGDVRDAEVMRERLRQLVDSQPDDLVLGPVLTDVTTELDRQHREAHERLVTELDGDRYVALLDRLDALVTSPPTTPLAARRADRVLPRQMHRAWQALEQTVQAALAEQRPDRKDLLLHDARKAAKRVRYAAESVQAVYGGDAKATAKAVTRVQEELGHHQDSTVARALLLELARRAGGNGFTYGRLHALEQVRGETAAARLPVLWAAADTNKATRWFTG